jgi:hypothetical protein
MTLILIGMAIGVELQVILSVISILKDPYGYESRAKELSEMARAIRVMWGK